MAVFLQTLRNALYMELVEACKRHVIGPEYMKTTLLLSKKSTVFALFSNS